ncbi:uncharacterized protein LOC106063339 [Biomphalaria glabrata]|uniref:Uncharacterized protein LOC106063339 n=1 Tax=Biomphalaria glabrata TaxID=6526 RepID=A0A9W3A9A8_BIOGL|nr:uncharacterized protein LOC106063339 [Biomphalaria glabrata]
MSTKHLSLLHCLMAVMSLLFWSSTLGDDEQTTMPATEQTPNKTNATQTEITDQNFIDDKFTKEGCSSFVSSWDLTDLPAEVAEAGQEEADEPENVRVTFENKTSKYMYVKLWWEYPTKNVNNPKGFMVYLENTETVVDCYVALLSENYTNPPHNMTLSHDFQVVLNHTTQYTVNVVSIPAPNEKPFLPGTFFPKVFTGSLITSGGNDSQIVNWSPNVVLRMKNALLEMKFTENKDFVPDRTYDIHIEKHLGDNVTREQMVYKINDSCITSEDEQSCNIMYLSQLELVQLVLVQISARNCVNSQCNRTFAVYTLANEVVSQARTDSTSTQPTPSVSSTWTGSPLTTSQIFDNTATGYQDAIDREEEPSKHSKAVSSAGSTEDTGPFLDDDFAQVASGEERKMETKKNVTWGLIGGAIAASLFTALVILFAVSDRSVPKTKKSGKLPQ